MYHVEIRQFPHNTCRFNLTEGQVRATIVEPWAREQWIELGERKWSPHQARLTVLEGPALPVEKLSMGRGWRNAQRQSQDVTESLLAAARQADSPVGATAPESAATSGAAGDVQLLADSLGLELLGALGSASAPLHRAWELADSRHPGRAPNESLAMAELAVRSLLRSGLLVLSRDEHGDGTAASPGEQDAEAILCAIGSWVGESTAPRVWMRRS
jgi:hypothetical protein